MKEIVVDVKSRETLGKNPSRRLRHEGLIPAIVYGAKKDAASPEDSGTEVTVVAGSVPNPAEATRRTSGEECFRAEKCFHIEKCFRAKKRFYAEKVFAPINVFGPKTFLCQKTFLRRQMFSH